MDDRTLIKISLAWALIGVFALILIASYGQPEQIKISELGDNIGKTVLIRGEISKINAKSSASFIDLSDNTGNATIIAFEKITNITAGNTVAVKGKVQMDKDEPELITSEIYCVKC